jgi:hypothetical protein
MTIKATIDRFEEGKAVLVVGENEDEYIVPHISLLHGVMQGSWLLIKVEDDCITNVDVGEQKPAKVKGRIAEKIARLMQWGHRQ